MSKLTKQLEGLIASPKAVEDGTIDVELLSELLKKQKTSNMRTGAVGNAFGAVGDLAKSFVPESTVMQGEYSNVASGLDAGYDMAANALLQSGNPWGILAGGLMKVNDAAGDFISTREYNGRKLGTTGDTLSDSILGSAFFESTLGAANAYYGKDVDKVNYDKKALGQIQASYQNSVGDVNRFSKDKRVGWLATKTGEAAKLEQARQQAQAQATIMSDIGKEAYQAQERQNSTAHEAALNRQKSMQGGFSYRGIVAKNGIKLPTEKDIQRIKNIKRDNFIFNWEEPELTFIFKDGGKTQKKEEKPKTRSLEELIQYAKEQNPRFVQRMVEPLKQLDLGNGDYATHMMAWAHTNDDQAMIFPTVMEDVEGNLQYYKDKALTEAYNRGDYLIMSPEEAQIFTTGYKQGWPMFFQQTPNQKFAEGGKMNIIPEGELHARLHHMEQEGITKKGIPVISEEEGGEIVQHAEIERNEIIFRLEVTKKLEELMKDGSDEAALEAGKLLVEEILNNTEDRTGLIQEIE